MHVRLPVLADQALAVLRALHPRPEALAVVLLALALLAGAPPHGDEGRDALEGPGVPEVGHLPRPEYLRVEAMLVAATGAVAAGGAVPPLREALAVHFEAVYFGALAALVGLLAGGEVHAGDRVHDGGVVEHGTRWILVDQLLEEVFGGEPAGEEALHFVLVDEPDGAGGGRASSGPYF